MSQIKTDGIDAAAVMVQEGTHDKPGIILGAAYTPLHTEAVADRSPRTGAAASIRSAKKKGRQQAAGLKGLGIEPYCNSCELWPGPSAPRGAGGLRNPERDPNRALRQQGIISQSSLACAWPK